MAIALPIVHGVVLGGEERYGHVDANGNFYETHTPTAGYQVPLQQINEGLAIPARSKAEILDLQGSPIAELFIGVVDGKPVCTEIKALAGKALTGEVLRQTPISTLVREAARANIVHLRNGFAVRFAQGNPLFWPKREWVSEHSRRTLDSVFLSRVADTYRMALATGEAPAMAVERILGPTTPENARRWVMAARKEGFLGKSKGPGRKGERYSS